MDAVTAAVVGAIRALGFVGNSHYCAGCMNTFHDDRGQHKPDCTVLAEIMDDDEWWDGRMGQEVTPA